MKLKDIEEQGLLLFKVIAGSQAYGTNTPTSDEDIRYVYILPEEHILGNKYVEQISEDGNDTVGYEIKRFLDLLQISNPNVVEFLNIPEDCILYKHPLFDLILAQKDKFITKQLRNTLVGYAKQQIQKANGQDKKMNWERDRVTRKTPLDFCYVNHGTGSMPLTHWLEKEGFKQEFCGLTNIPHMRDMYYLYYDFASHYGVDDGPEFETPYFKGVIQDMELSNTISLSSIPKDMEPTKTLYYNGDGYSMHCKEYKEYQEWLEKRNMQRWVDTQAHGQMIDGKNMMHCVRLLRMGVEIATGQGFNVRRPDAEYLKSIRRGEVVLADILANATEESKQMDELFKQSNLPEAVDKEMCHEILVKIRKEFYKPKLMFTEPQLTKLCFAPCPEDGRPCECRDWSNYHSMIIPFVNEVKIQNDNTPNMGEVFEPQLDGSYIINRFVTAKEPNNVVTATATMNEAGEWSWNVYTNISALTFASPMEAASEFALHFNDILISLGK